MAARLNVRAGQSGADLKPLQACGYNVQGLRTCASTRNDNPAFGFGIGFADFLQMLMAAVGPTRSRRSSSTKSAYWGEAENICSLRGFRILTLSRRQPSRGTEFMEGRAGSFHLDAGKLYHLAPFLGLVCDELPEVAGCHWHRHATHIGIRAFSLGLASPASISLFSFSTTSAGVFLGTPSPCHELAS